MSKKPDTNGEPAPAPTEQELDNARKCFSRGQELASKKNFDYAVQMYLSGLEHWPDAVEEGHKPCRAAALFRGPQKVGFMEQRKLGDKDPKRAMLNAETLLSKDTRNVGYMEAMFVSAIRGGYHATAMWIGEIFGDAAAREDKPQPSRFDVMRKQYEELSDRLAPTDHRTAVIALERAVDAAGKLSALKPQDMEIATSVRHLAGKLTILRGKYSSAESFRDSIENAEGQRDLHDADRSVQSDERMDELIAKATADYNAHPTTSGPINNLVTLLLKREIDADENKAIGILVKAFQATNEYRYKMRAEDIRIKQLERKRRQIIETGNREAAREHLKEQLKFELGVYKDRVRQYPTDLRLRYEFGKRLFAAAKYDEAIPILQEARTEPRVRHRCNLFIGRCFFEKGYHGQAIDILREAIEQYEAPDDDLGKEMHYYLGRAFEAGGQVPDALKVYGQLIQWDYNYRNGEVRKRIDNLRRPPENPGS